MGEPVIRPVPAWVKQPRCEACQHWLEPHDPVHPLLGRCSQRSITAWVGGIFVNELAPVRNTGYCDSWTPVANFYRDTIPGPLFDVDDLIERGWKMQLDPALPEGPVRRTFWNMVAAMDNLRRAVDPAEWDRLKGLITNNEGWYLHPDWWKEALEDTP